MRGGANGARVRLAPQKDWAVNNPAELANTLNVLEGIQQEFNDNSRRRKISLADTIVLAGAAAIEKAAADAGFGVEVPFTPGRTDASQEMTDVNSFSHLELKADAFRNYYSDEAPYSPVVSLVDKADLLNLTVPEMTVLLGGMRVLNTNTDGSSHGVFTANPGTLSNDFFVNLLDLNIEWNRSSEEGVYTGTNRETGETVWTGTPVDLIFGSNSELRAVAEFYGADDAKEMFVNDFVNAWSKVMMADRFELDE